MLNIRSKIWRWALKQDSYILKRCNTSDTLAGMTASKALPSQSSSPKLLTPPYILSRTINKNQNSLSTFVFKSNLSLLIDFKFLRQVNPIFQTRWIFFIKILNKTSSWSPICYLLRPPSPCYFNSRYHPEYWKFHILDTDALAN